MSEMQPRDPEQGWYWTASWQDGEREAEADIAAGNVTVHTDVDALLARLDGA